MPKRGQSAFAGRVAALAPRVYRDRGGDGSRTAARGSRTQASHDILLSRVGEMVSRVKAKLHLLTVTSSTYRLRSSSGTV
jgi:hypothetical protein